MFTKQLLTIQKFSLLLLIINFTFLAHGQSFIGPHLSQYDPLKATYFNPASLPNSELRWQVNILSADVTVGNDLIKLSTYKGIFKDFDPYQFFDINMNGKDKNISINSDIRGPGFMVNFGKNSIAVGTRIREVSSINGINEELAYSLFHHYNDILNYIPNFTNEKATAAVNAYGEYSLAFARKLIDGKAHELSVGANIKVLDKIFYSTLDVKNITFDKYSSIIDSSVNAHQSEFDIEVSNDLQDKKFKHNWKPDGWAIDAGVEYAFKPTKLSGKYLIKIGVALNDFGQLKQTLGNSSFHFIGNEKEIPAENLIDENGDIKSFTEIFDSLGTRTSTAGDKKITLPSVMHFYIDVRALPKFYIYGGIQVNPYDFKKKVGLAYLPTRFNLIPRVEFKSIGIYAPLAWDQIDNISSGVGFRFKQFSVGSSNIISSIIKNNYSNVNIYLSLAIGGKRRTEKI
ncbi:MAG: hypothetical protein LC105_00135 [Chitinophagales bacterium]|nr:hypothetical protein [Chitinophagales bacterium]MCZ2392252.1 hypothetical protein [Chitinophagales bacterium]